MSMDCVLMTLKPRIGHSACRVAVMLKALCEDDSDNGASLGDLEIRGTDKGIEIGYFNQPTVKGAKE